jgi:hypothetical protein
MAYSIKVPTKASLKQYILAKLGSPVIQIELTDEQLDFCIDDTMEMYYQTATGGMLERYIPIQLLTGIQSYVLPNDIFSVLDVHSVRYGGISHSAPANIFSINQYVASDLYRGSGKIDLLTYELTNNMLASLELILTKKHSFDFSPANRTIHLFEIPKGDENVVLQVYRRNVPVDVPNPDYTIGGTEPEFIESSNIYSEMIVRKIATEKARYQWATNLLKYSGSQLPNGLQLNVDGILAESKENLTKYEEELHQRWSTPVDFFIG